MLRAFDRDDYILSEKGPSPSTLGREHLVIPGGRGFGVAIIDGAWLAPYQSLTHGKQPARIGGFRPYGFEAVIDLGTDEATARLHRVETETAGMRYVNIPINGDLPDRQQTARFAAVVVTASSAPTLLYAPSADLLATFWVAYRLSVGAPMKYSLNEGRGIGMMPHQERHLMTLWP